MRSTGYIVNGKYIKAAKVPSKSSMPRKQPLHKQYEIDRAREDYRKDLIQPFINGQPNKEFIKAYPELIHKYFTAEQITKAERS